MTEYPTRAIVFEPFVSQMEIIDKTLIEVQNQPASYYGRRNNRTGAGQGLLSQPYYSKYNGNNNNSNNNNNNNNNSSSSSSSNNNNNNFYHHHQPQVYSDYYNGYRTSGVGRAVHAENPNMAGLGGNLNSVAALGGGAFGAAPANGAALYGQSPAAHVPQVFNDRAVFSAEGAQGPFGEQKKSGLSTFDPFGMYPNDYTEPAAYPPLFNSSSDYLGTTFSSNSTNIWGDTNKTMVNDAAVWG